MPVTRRIQPVIIFDLVVRCDAGDGFWGNGCISSQNPPNTPYCGYRLSQTARRFCGPDRCHLPAGHMTCSQSASTERGAR